MDDCNNNKKEITCPTSTDECSMLSVKYKADNVEIKSYKKTCTTEAVCENPGVSLTEWARCDKADGKCSFQCCHETDLCNRGHAVPMVSTLLMFACALVTFFR